jgi:predicted alpha/beta hydrolase family esterase
MARLEDVLLGDSRPALLVAHSLGCHLVAAWAAHSQHTGRVQAALLVAPPDTERPDMPPQLATWGTMARERLPFPATLLYSEDDPYCAPVRAQGLAADWGATAHGTGAAGHLNSDSGLGGWPAGWAHLMALQYSASP